MNENESVEWRRGSQDFDLYELNEGMNVVDESQLGDKWKIELIEQWMKMKELWIKKRESIFWLRNECNWVNVSKVTNEI